MKIYKIAQNNGKDTQYLELISNKRFKEAKQLVIQKAQTNGYTFGPAHHGSQSSFTKFDANYSGRTDDGYFGSGFYFTPFKSYASEFGKVMSFYLRLKKPLTLPSASVMNHSSLIQARDILGRIMGREDLIPITTLPEGYEVKKVNEHEWGRDTGREVYAVYPKEELYGTEQERYGSEELTPEQSIVSFNDEMRDTKWNSGWLMGLTRDIGRKRMVSAIQQKGYDSILVSDADENNHISEIVLWDPSSIKMVNTVTYDDGHKIIPLSKRFDAGNNDFRY